MNRIAKYLGERLDALESGLCAGWTHERRVAAYLAYLDALTCVQRPGHVVQYPWFHSDTPSMADLVACRRETLTAPVIPGSQEDFNAFMVATFPEAVSDAAEFFVDPGWRQILIELAKTLTGGERLHGAKSKYAGLVVHGLEEDDPRVQRAMSAATRTCETCSLPGRRTETRHRWEVIACPLHDEMAEGDDQ